MCYSLCHVRIHFILGISLHACKGVERYLPPAAQICILPHLHPHEKINRLRHRIVPARPFVPGPFSAFLRRDPHLEVEGAEDLRDCF